MVIRHLKQNGKVKKLDKWVPHKLTANQKNSWFEVFAFSYCTQQQQFHNLIVTCDKKWILYNWWRPAQLVDREAVSKHTQSQTYTKKMSWSLFGNLLPVWSTTAIWILAKPLHLRSILSKSVRCTELSHSGQQKGPNSSWQHPTACHTTNASKVEWIGLQSFAPYAIFTRPLANQLPFFMHLNSFLQGKRFHNQEEAENAFQEFIESWSMDFYATGMNKLIFHWQKCADCNGFYFD